MTALQQPRNLLDLPVEEKQHILNSFDYIFSDIDGVVWKIDQSIVGSSDGFKLLQKAGKKLCFITNNSGISDTVSLDKLQRMGVSIESLNLINPLKCIVDYLKSIEFSSALYAIGTEHFKNVLRESGFHVEDGPNRIINENFADIFHAILDDIDKDRNESVGAVIIDYDFNMNALKMMKALYYLRDPNCLLICGAPDITLPAPGEITLLGPGTFVEAIKSLSKHDMLTFGKPSQLMADIMRRRFNVSDSQRVLFIGDSLKQDISFGKIAGFKTLLVLSGINSLNDVKQQTDTKFIPDYYINSMKDFVTFFEDL